MTGSFELPGEPRIVHAEPSFVAAYKPPRLHTAPLRGSGEATLAAWLRERFPEFDRSFPIGAEGAGPEHARRPVEGGLVHRLDYETSGIVLFARSPETLAYFLAEQEAGRLAKIYRLCAALGAAPGAGALGLPGSRPRLGTPQGIDPGPWQESLVGAAASSALLPDLAAPLGGRTIESRFRSYGPGGARVACLGSGEVPGRGRSFRRGSPERSYQTEILSAEARGDCLLAEIRLLRGFRHQIRAHFAWLGLPLLGDTLYGGREAPRLFLHAAAMEFVSPATGRPVRLEC